jgi:hypothetical protein
MSHAEEAGPTWSISTATFVTGNAQQTEKENHMPKPVVSNLPKDTPNLPSDRMPVAPGTDSPIPTRGTTSPMPTGINRTPGHDATGLPDRMPKAPGHRHAGTPAPEHVVAAESEIPWMARAKQKWTMPAPVSTVRGLQAGTVLPAARIQPVPGFTILGDKHEHRA